MNNLISERNKVNTFLKTKMTILRLVTMIIL